MSRRRVTPAEVLAPCGCPVVGGCKCEPLFYIEADVEARVVRKPCGTAELDHDEDGYQATCTDCGSQSPRSTRLGPIRMWQDDHALTARS